MTIKTWEDQYQAKCAELEIAQGTLKNLWARVAELEEELEKSRLHIKHIGNDALRTENASLRSELVAIRNQQTIGYLEKHLIESGRKIQLCNLTKTRLWSDSVPVYLAAGAQPDKENDTTLKINLEFDDGEVEIVAHGTTLNMQRLEARLKRGLAADKELAAVRNQQPVAYRAWFDKDSGARFLFTLWPGEERLDVDWESLFLAAGAQPRCPHCDGTGDVHSIDGEWRGVCDCGAGAQPVPEGMALDAGAKLNSCTGCYADQVIGESRPCRTCIRSGAISDRFEAAKEPK